MLICSEIFWLAGLFGQSSPGVEAALKAPNVPATQTSSAIPNLELELHGPPTNPMGPRTAASAAALRFAPSGQEKEVPKARWYGWMPLIPDTAAVGLYLLAELTEEPALLLPSLILFALGGPLIHYFVGHTNHAVGSAILRVFGPSALAGISVLFIGAARGEVRTMRVGSLDVPNGLVSGFASGMAVSIAIDSAAISWHPRPPGEADD